MSAASTRRGALGFTAAALVAGLTSPVLAKGVQEAHTPDPDAGPIRLCAQFFVADANLVRWENDISLLDEEAGDVLVQKWDSLIPLITATPATSAAGRRAKSAVAFSVMRYANDVISEEHHALVRSALTDVIAGSAMA